MRSGFSRSLLYSGPLTILCTLVFLVASALPSAAEPAQAHDFVSRPDLAPPMVRLETANPGTGAGYVFLAPYGPHAQNGPMIIDDTGQPVWAYSATGKPRQFATDAKVQRYQGQPVITWWEGTPRPGFGVGRHVIMNQSYEEIATVRAGNGLVTDMHELVITPRDTAYVVSYNEVQQDRAVREGVIQEIDIATGQVLFEWHSLDHIAPNESTMPAPDKPKTPYDYFHINSVTEDAEGDLTISARHTDAIYQIDKETGQVQWRLGGKRSDFSVPADATFARQHNARWLPDGTLSLFDNHSETQGPTSRGLILDLDEAAGTVAVVKSFAHPDGTTSVSQGNQQILPGGNSIIGWGSQPQFTEFSANGDVLLHGSFGAGMMSYRAYRSQWTGTPTEPPAAVQQLDANGVPTLYMSWNGSTELASWRVLAGSNPQQLTQVAEVPKAGFETAVALPDASQVAVAVALDGEGNVIGRSVPARAPAFALAG